VRLPLSWLKDHVEHGLSPEDLAERLTATGTLVEGIERRGVPQANGNVDAFRIGKVIEAVPHPNADRLRLCRVDTGDAESPRQIVCGAPNVAAGQTVAVALPGAVLPGDPEPLGRRKIRGVESHGMILSQTEVELGQNGDGIMVLDDALEAGSLVADALPLVETVLELELTPNRPDCMSISGLAREVAAVTGAGYCPPVEDDPPAEGQGAVGDYITLTVEDPDLCPRYMGRVLTDVRVGPSPVWLAARIEAAGMRAISNIVDITNYVMLLTGQPLHAFDLDRLAGPAIVARRAREGEPIATLDGKQRVLDRSVLAICDAERPAVIAGVFGAELAEVSEATTRVFLEAATFNGPNILATELKLGLRTESSSRFEKGLPQELAARGLSIACRLLVELCGAKLVPGTLDVCEPIPPRPTVHLRHARATRILGMEITPEESAAILRRVGCEVAEGAEGHDVHVPFERAGDLTREADLIEEVGRVHGLDRVPAELPRLVGRGRRTPEQAHVDRLTRLACDLGLNEAITYSFVPETDADRLRLPAGDPRREVVRLANPLSEDMAVMRRSLLPGLLRAVAHNQAHQRPDGGLFEVGRGYAPAAEGMAEERQWLTAVVFGEWPGHAWRAGGRPVDLYAGTGLATALARGAGVREVRLRPGSSPYGHPARQADAMSGDSRIGWAGEVHPLVLRAFDVKGPCVALGLDLARTLEAARPPAFEDLLTVPVSTRDISVVVGGRTLAADLMATAGAVGGRLVREVSVADRYAGEQAGEGRVSLLLRLQIADPGRTLTDDEIEACVEAVVQALAERHGAERRA
jgi:phenylalanyl-tRNA synthetase beta chain